MPTTSHAPAFSLVTYNILADAHVRPRRYPNSPAAALEPRARRERCLARICELDADIYCLQEVEPELFAAIGARLGPSYRGVYEQKRGQADGLAIFVRGPNFELHAHRALHYTSGTQRDAQLALVATVIAPGRTLTIANTHLRWQPSETPRDEHVGRAQLLELLRLRSEDDDAESQWLLAGDFNALSQSVVLQAALERGWQLSCRSQRPWDTCNINGRRRKIDYILHEGRRLQPKPDPLPRLERDTPMPSLSEPSDHLPVRVRFESGS